MGTEGCYHEETVTIQAPMPHGETLFIVSCQKCNGTLKKWIERKANGTGTYRNASRGE